MPPKPSEPPVWGPGSPAAPPAPPAPLAPPALALPPGVPSKSNLMPSALQPAATPTPDAAAAMTTGNTVRTR
ncbi:hypothetical protein [Sorangium sp. So ce861]|uniref:hypothetical protein n=1 Tax=Sorangium sp. So ce861 TaxID=3133323 RepID=UPI003F63018E